jgi:PPOX class probable F420-dependent enzyme
MATTNLTADQLAFLAAARTATLATIAPDGSPRLVPVCFVVRDGTDLYVPLDEKPKRIDDPRHLARVRDILERPAVALLVDRWSEDWSELGWLRLGGTATLLEPVDAPVEHAMAVAALRAKYPQYVTHRLDERPLIRIGIVTARSWGSLSTNAD